MADILATFIHARGKNFGTGTISHPPAKGDWIDIGPDVYVVTRKIWNYLVDPHELQVIVEHVETTELDTALERNIELIQKLSDTPPQ